MAIDHGLGNSGVPIHQYLQQHLDPAGRLPEGLDLPDAGSRTTLPDRRAEPGDGRASEVATALLRAMRRPSARRLSALYARVVEDDVADYLDALVELLTEAGADGRKVRAVGLWLATTSPHRGPVKLGIALLGIGGVGEDAGVARTLGAHHEFTPYCTAALARDGRRATGPGPGDGPRGEERSAPA